LSHQGVTLTTVGVADEASATATARAIIIIIIPA